MYITDQVNTALSIGGNIQLSGGNWVLGTNATNKYGVLVQLVVSDGSFAMYRSTNQGKNGDVAQLDQTFAVLSTGIPVFPHLVGSAGTYVSVDTGGVLGVGTPSDSTLKRNIVPLGSETDVLASLSLLSGSHFEWDKRDPRTAKWGTGRQFGVLSDEIEQVIPEAVWIDPTDGSKRVNYLMIGPYLIEVVKAQEQQIVELQQVLTTKDTQIAELQSTLSTVLTRLNKLDGGGKSATFTVTTTPEFTVAGSRRARQVSYQVGVAPDGGVQ